jgi:hypothetical protein
MKLRLSDVIKKEPSYAHFTSKPGNKVGLTPEGLFVYKNRGKFHISVAHYSLEDKMIHLSPHFITKADDVFFKAVAEHEMIHAFHHAFLGIKYNSNYSENIAYKHSGNGFLNAGAEYYEEAIRNFDLGNSFGSKASHPKWFLIPDKTFSF